MEEEYEEILSKLTPSEIDLLVRYVQYNIRPNDAKEEDNLSLLSFGLFHREEIKGPHESYTANRESRVSYGPPVPSDFGREWVAWYKTRRS